MRRQELTEAATTVLKALSASSLRATLSQHLTNVRQAGEAELPSPEYLISSMRTYWSFANLFTPNEKRVVNSLNLARLEDSKFWSDLLSAKTDKLEDAHDAVATIAAAENHLPTVLSLIGDVSSEQDENSLSLVLPEEEGRASRPARVVGAIESVDLLYSVYAELSDRNPAALALSACDSGEDKLFVFTGDAEIIAALKKCLLELWDRLVFFRDRQSETYLEFLAESLPVMAKIADLHIQGELSESQTEALKAGLLESVKKFVSAGAVIPEIVTVASVQPYDLLMPEKDMFVAPPNDIDGTLLTD